MDRTNTALTAWSFGLVGAVYLAFALNLIRLGYWRPPRNVAGLALLGALSSTSLWGWFTVAGVLSGKPPLELLATLADVSRYGFWFGFLLLLIRPRQMANRPPTDGKAIAVVAVALVAGALTIQTSMFLGPDLFPTGSRLGALSSLLLSIFGLVLVEQMFRNISPDSRWNAKPVSLALAGTFAFDVYLYSQAVVFGRVDVDAYSIRGAVHSLMVPLLLISTTRRADWISQLRVSRGAAFHSATLLICGAYLIFISAVGYYVRYFGGEWGRALQLGIVFVSLILLTILRCRGRVRAKLRVFLDKNFFRYRYDYREEWLKFTSRLCAQNTPQEMGQQVIQGLADLVESPGGGLWMKKPGAAAFQQTARVNCGFSQRSRRMRLRVVLVPAPTRRESSISRSTGLPRASSQSLSLPPWLQSMPQAWLDRSRCSWGRIDRLRRAFGARTARRCQLGGLRPAEHGQPASGELSGANGGHRGAARGAQVRCVQSNVGVRRARPEEHRHAALADDEERQTASRQSGISAGHDDDGREFAGEDAPADGSAQRGHDPAGHPVRRRSDRHRPSRRSGRERPRASDRGSGGSNPSSRVGTRNGSSASSDMWSRMRSMPPTPRGGSP